MNKAETVAWQRSINEFMEDMSYIRALYGSMKLALTGEIHAEDIDIIEGVR